MRTSLGQRDDGLWAAFEVALNVGRQSGKGSILEARELVGLFLLHEPLIIHSAHEFKTSFEHFLRMVALVEGTPMLDSRVRRIRRGAGEQAIELVTGARLRFVARSGGASGRGFSAPCVVIDEAQEMTSAMLGAMMPTLAAQKNPQVWYAGSAEHAKSHAWHGVRKRAVEGNSPRLFYAGWNNAADVVDDEEAVRRSNPAYGIRISAEFVDAERAAMPESEFRRERLGIPDDLFDAERPAGPISPDEWAALTDGSSSVVAETASVAADVGNGWHVAAVAGDRPDGLKHGGLVVSNKDERVFVGELAAACEALGVSTVTLPKGSPGEALAKPLKAAGLEVDLMTSTDQTLATSELIKAATGLAPTIRHRGEPTLSKQFGVAVTKPAGNGGQVWVRPLTGDVAAVFALTMAFGRLGGAAVPDPAMNVW